MNTIITFTLTQLVGLVLAICAKCSFNTQKTYPPKFADHMLYIQRKITEALANISEG